LLFDIVIVLPSLLLHHLLIISNLSRIVHLRNGLTGDANATHHQGALCSKYSYTNVETLARSIQQAAAKVAKVKSKLE
jgi:hypothetical protein